MDSCLHADEFQSAVPVGLVVRSHTLGIVMSAYGGSRSIYVNFFGRGRNISFPKDTTLEIGFGGQTATPISSQPLVISVPVR
jgi:hypothetical protein